MKIWSAICAGVVAAGLGGCAGMAPPPADHLFDKADAAERFAHERQHLGGRQPKLGLALSGGGTKAAVFSHGVMHGLADQGILDHVDVISSTSGGGYAAYWLMAKRLDAIRNPRHYGGDYRAIFQDCFPAWMIAAGDSAAYQKLLAAARQKALAAGQEVCRDVLHFSDRKGGDPYRWQAHLLRWPDVFEEGFTPLTGEPQSAPYFNEFVAGLATLLEGPFSWLGGERDSYLATSYQYGIERAWGLHPRERAKHEPPDSRAAWDYTNASTEDPRWVRPPLHVDSGTMKWADLRAAYAQEPTLPLWVLNTMQGQKAKAPNPHNLFELTPFQYGSPRWGYVKEPPPLESIAQGVRASAAFADSQGMWEPRKIKWLEAAARLFPGASWGVPFRHPGSPGALRLSDGGGADNLALVSAVRRGLDDVIVVDTDHDPSGRMDQLCWSRNLLVAEGFRVSFPALDGFDEMCDRQLPGREGAQQLAYNVSAWLNPVVHGTLTWPNSQRVTHIWLIKAAWDEQAVRRAFNEAECGFDPGDVNCVLAMFWGNARHEDGKFMSFPQHGTAALTLDGSANIVLAYREVGRMLARHLKRDGQGRLSLLRATQCHQPSHDRINGDRPEGRPAHSRSPHCIPVK